MPPKKRAHETHRWQPKAEPDSSWLVHTAQRLERRAEQQPLPEAAPGGPSAAYAAAARLAREQQRRRGEPFAPPAAADTGSDEDEVDPATLMISQREYYRTGAGMTATMFEPQRNTYFVCGRPVQVPFCLHIDAQYFCFNARVWLLQWSVRRT